MTTIQQPKNKALTAKQYEFYKRKGMTDDKVRKLHGFNNAGFYAWKEQHNLKGVKFEKDVKTVKSNDMGNVSSVGEKSAKLQEKEVAAPKLYENKEVKERLSGFKVESEKEEVQPDTHERYETLGSLSVGEPSVVSINSNKPAEMERVEIPESLLLKQENEKLKEHIASLEDRHVKESQLIDELRRDVKDANKERYVEIERGDEWRTKARNFERELDKVKQERSIKVSNLENEVKRLDQALSLHAEDETLLFLTMQKAVQMRSRVTESVEEGGRSTWI